MMMSEVKPKKVYRRSLINKYFTQEDYLRLYEITLTSGIDNNEKYILMQEYLRDRDIPFQPLGCGTNRQSLMIDGYAVKFALDSDGIDF